MKILTLEFSSNRRSVAVAETIDEGGVRILASARDQPEVKTTGMMLLARALNASGALPAEIGLIIVGLGPGSFHGIRSAIAIAQGWQLARDVALLGISSVESLAYEAFLRGLSGEIHFVIDAQRAELYHAKWLITPEHRVEIQPLRVISARELPAGEMVAGPGASKFFPGALDVHPTAEGLAFAGARREDYLPAEKLEPLYLRESAFVKAPAPRIAASS